MLRFVFLILVILPFTAACTSKPPPELKSPCVSADTNSAESPCVRRPVNANWLG